MFINLPQEYLSIANGLLPYNFEKKLALWWYTMLRASVYTNSIHGECSVVPDLPILFRWRIVRRKTTTMVLYVAAMVLAMVLVVALGCAIGLCLTGLVATLGEPRRQLTRLKLVSADVLPVPARFEEILPGHEAFPAFLIPHGHVDIETIPNRPPQNARRSLP